MLRYTLAIAALLGMATAVDHWAVIVAGSNGFWNYRHQADVCHAYQIMKRNGIPEDNIILMSYDDVANDPENPFPGKLFNKPNGNDVYAGCKIDYKGDAVTPSNFLNILKGNAAGVKGGNGKVLKSNENSKVFINFADHGAPGLIAFPNEYLYANDLNSAINYMHENKMYQEMVLYIEACESGSMFDGILANNINVYAITAANPTESSWGTYCYPDDEVQGVHINSCLGDLFSVNWMEDADATDASKESLEVQFQRILKKTDKSHVMRYGDTHFKNEPVGNFYGNLNSPDVSEALFQRLFSAKKDIIGSATEEPKQHMTATSSRDAKLAHIWAVASTKKSHKSQLDLTYEVTRRMRVDHVFEAFAPQSLQDGEYVRPTNFDCLKTLVNTFESQCGKFDDYSLQYVKYFVQGCESLKSNETVDTLVNKVISACAH